MKYRKEIDGLRAISVLPVVLFHSGAPAFSGGYIGVDIFFVISGYLITSILVYELNAGDFSIINFYERRARRILPALFFVIVACMPFAWLWMSPVLFQDFAESIIAVVFFGSNFLFWMEDGYFAQAAELKPLLHTWSLAVEEQYYLFFPLLLMLLWRRGYKTVFWVIAALAIASLILSEYASKNMVTANFYLTPTRSWELLSGSIAALLMERREIRPNRILSAIGLGMIIFSIFLFDGNTRFPSLYTLIPVVGAVFIVLFAQRGTEVARLLSTPILVGVGLVSYSAYLWHQPLFAFARIKSAGEPSEILMLCLVVMAFVLGAISWRFVEQPFRGRANTSVSLTQADVFRYSGAAGLVLTCTSLIFMSVPTQLEITNPKLFTEFTEPQIEYDDCEGFDSISTGNASCRVFGNGEKSVVIWGDSHAEVLSKAIRPVPGYSVYVLNHAGCPPSAGVWRVDSGSMVRNCGSPEALVRYLEYVKRLQPEVTVLTARWTLYLRGWYRQGKLLPNSPWVVDTVSDAPTSAISSTKALQRGLKRTIEELSGLSGVYLMTQPADLHFMGPHSRLVAETIARTGIDDWHSPESELMAELSTETDAKVLLTKKLFCSAQSCSLRNDGYPLYSDDNHLSLWGASIQWKMVENLLGQIY